MVDQVRDTKIKVLANLKQGIDEERAEWKTLSVTLKVYHIVLNLMMFRIYFHLLQWYVFYLKLMKDVWNQNLVFTDIRLKSITKSFILFFIFFVCGLVGSPCVRAGKSYMPWSETWLLDPDGHVRARQRFRTYVDLPLLLIHEVGQTFILTELFT